MKAKIYLDTNVFIGAFEKANSSNSLVWTILNAIEAGELAAATSEITYAELLPKLILDRENELISLYRRLFSSTGFFEALPISRNIIIEAAYVRAVRLSIRLPDAIHLATANIGGCIAILSNDRRLAVPGRVPIVAVGPHCLAEIRAMTL